MAAILSDDRFARWLAALEARYLADLTFQEVSRALRALSAVYVERRARLGRRGALAGRGTRAAFALFYGPLHHLLVREIVQALPGAAEPAPKLPVLVDLGCGTGASGAAWAAAWTADPGLPGPPLVLGIDRHPWALAEAARTYREFGLTSRVRQADLGVAGLPKPPVSVLAAFALNELPPAARDALLTRLVDRARAGRAPRQADRLLIVEPMAGFVSPWWTRWRNAIVAAGGRADEWRFRVQLPPVIAKLDQAAGLNHQELTGRSLWLMR